MKLYKLTFITIVFTALACSGQHVDPNAEVVFNKLKPELLELFPESLLLRTEYVPSIKFDGNISISEVSYVLSNVTASVSKETQDECENRLRDPFLTWMKYSDILSIEGLNGCFGGTHWGSNSSESDLESSDKIPSSSLYFYDEQRTLCFHLNVEFIERQENLLIIRCRLILNLPPPSESELGIVSPNIRCINDEEGKREYEVTFELMNQSDTELNVATDSFYTSAPQRNLSIAEIQIRLFSRSLIDGQNPSIQTLQPGDKISIRDTFYAGTSVLSSFVVTYKTELIDSLKSDYWQGKVTSEIIEMEPEHGAYRDNAR